jgi:hypothetical protein
MIPWRRVQADADEVTGEGPSPPGEGPSLFRAPVY